MGRIAEPIIDRMRRGVEVDDNGCWNWQGAVSADGYGRIAMPSGKIGGYRDFTHRVAYETFVGPIPEGLVLDHLCRNRACCNPDHLEPVTQRTNLLRGAGAAKTHCKFGHEFTPENTRLVPRGRRCKACERRRSNESAARRRAAHA